LKQLSDYLDCKTGSVIVTCAPELGEIAHLIADRLRVLEFSATNMNGLGTHAIQEAIDATVTPPIAFILISDGVGVGAELANRELEKNKIPCLFVTVEAGQCRIGPWTYYGHTPCWQCSETTNKFFFGELQSDHGSHRPADADIALAVADALRDIAAGTSSLIEGSILIDSPERRSQRILKDPLCPVCSLWARQPTEAFYVEQD
jgi:hypothetical protein